MILSALGARKGLMLGLFYTLLLAGPSAAQEFTDFSLDTGGGDGGVSEGTPASGFTLNFTISGNDNSGSNIATRFQTTATADTDVEYSWDYTTDDSAPNWDPAGVTVNGSDTRLTDDSGGRVQAGAGSFEVDAGDSFGWFVLSTDGCCGAGFLTVNASFTLAAGTAFAFGDLVQTDPGSDAVSVTDETRTGLALDQPGESGGFDVVGADATIRIESSTLRADTVFSFGENEAFAIDLAGIAPESTAGSLGSITQSKINNGDITIQSSILNGLQLLAVGSNAVINAAGASATFAITSVGPLPGDGVISGDIAQAAVSNAAVTNGASIVLAGAMPAASSASIAAQGASASVRFAAFAL